MQIIPTDFHCRQFRILEIVTCFLRKTAKTAGTSPNNLENNDQKHISIANIPTEPSAIAVHCRYCICHCVIT